MKGIACLLATALLASGCAGVETLAAATPENICPKPGPAPQDLMVERPASFQRQMEIFLFGSPPTPIATPSN